MYAAITDVVPDAAFTIFTGDMIDHAIWNTSRAYNEAESTSFNTLLSLPEPGDTDRVLVKRQYGVMNGSLAYVYATAGNHEEHPTNAFQPNSLGDKAQWIYSVLSSEWSRWIGPDATVDAEKFGAYSTRWPGGNLRIISLNTNLYYRQNYYLYRKNMLRDPSEQLNWLVNELDAAEKAGENVYIIGHMPLGDHNTFRDQSNYLDQIVQRYEATIAAMFFGHTHRDEFQISYSDNSKKSFQTAITTSYIGPSLTPTSGQPSFRVYEVDPETFAIMDTITYIADMGSETFQTQGPVWTKYYSAKEAYGSLLDPPVADSNAELSASFWHNVTELFEKDESIFESYMIRKSRGWKDVDCGDSCREEEVCKIRASRSQDNCFEPSPGISFKKGSESRSEERDECGISVSRATLGALAVKREVLESLHRRYMEEWKLQRQFEPVT
jgi:sphingomyelin phosphodiesterase